MDSKSKKNTIETIVTTAILLRKHRCKIQLVTKRGVWCVYRTKNFPRYKCPRTKYTRGFIRVYSFHFFTIRFEINTVSTYCFSDWVSSTPFSGWIPDGLPCSKNHVKISSARRQTNRQHRRDSGVLMHTLAMPFFGHFNFIYTVDAYYTHFGTRLLKHFEPINRMNQWRVRSTIKTINIFFLYIKSEWFNHRKIV